jgi:hypothetical protein
MVGEALAIPGSGGRGVGAISITPEYRRRLDMIDGKKVPVWSAQDEGRPLLAFAGGWCEMLVQPRSDIILSKLPALAAPSP